jgi:hypothetical protein
MSNVIEAGVSSERRDDKDGPRVAHVASAKGSMVALCGYRARGVMTREEARRSPWCVVCADLYAPRA